MKIAIYEPEPRVCGPLSWAFHLKSGMLANGHTCDIISSTKSGKSRVSWGESKPGARWWLKPMDRVEKDVNVAAALDEYDLVVLPEIRNPSKDKEAVKDREKSESDDLILPTYVNALRQLKNARWTTALHGNKYLEKDMPFVHELLEAPTRGNTLVTLSWDSVNSNEEFQQMKWVKAHLPYAPTYGPDDEISDRDPLTVGATGRFIYNKGQHIVCMAGGLLPEDVTVEVWGACSIGPSPSPTYIVYETLLNKLGWTGTRYGHDKSSEDDPAGGNIIQPFNWDARLDGRALVRYLGNYTQPVQTAERMAVHANLTSSSFSGDLVEFSTLEAMDAGALSIVPRHLSDDAFRASVLPTFSVAPSIPKLLKDMTPVEELAVAIEKCLAIRRDPHLTRDIVRHNREVLRTRNDPRVVAETMIESAMS